MRAASLSFLTCTTPPELLRESAQRFDSLVRDTFLHIMQLSPERIAKSGVATAEELRDMISLPLKLGGMGLRPAERIAASAYFASAASILPDFLRAFPVHKDGSFAATELHQQLEACHSTMLQQGMSGTPAETASTGASVPVARGKSGPKPAAAALKMAAEAATALRKASFDESPSLAYSVSALWDAAAAFNSSVSSKKGAFLQGLAERVQRSDTSLIEAHSLQRASS
jgi:hypothetical protein